jgi:hypothetical protein
MANNRTSIDDLINNLKSDRNQTAIKLINDNPVGASIITKLVSPKDKSKQRNLIDRKQREHTTAFHGFKHTVNENVNNVAKIRDLIKLFPDMKLAAQILVSSILAPKDMYQDTYTIRCESENIPSGVAMKLNQILEKEINNIYKHKDELSDIVNKSLIETGSFVKVVLPENVLDSVINSNVAAESFNTDVVPGVVDSTGSVINYGILGEAKKKAKRKTKAQIARESYNCEVNAKARHNPHPIVDMGEGKAPYVITSVEIVDNPYLLQLPDVMNERRSVAIENAVYNNISRTVSQLYKSGDVEQKPLLEISSNNAIRASIGRAFVMNIPSECVCPVFVPGRPEDHVGYIIALDEEGNSITTTGGYMSSELSSNIQKSYTGGSPSDLGAMLTGRAANNMSPDSKRTVGDREQLQLYTSIIEQDILDRLQNGVYNRRLEMAKRDEIFRVMLARSLSNRLTRLVYIPKEFVTYYAFDYHPNGVGKSILDDLGVILSIRAILLFGKVMREMKNSVAMTKVKINFSPDDPDVHDTVEMAVNEILRTRQQYFPLGLTSPADLVDWIQRSGFMFEFEGHPDLPETRFEFESVSTDIREPNNELDEMLREQTYMAYGLSPEAVDSSKGPDFATTAALNSIMFAKRVLILQGIFSTHDTDYIKKIAKHDMVIRKKFIDAIKSDIATIRSHFVNKNESGLNTEKPDFKLDDVINDYICHLVVELPKPDLNPLENMSKAYDNYKSGLETALDAWISDEVAPDGMSGEMSGSISAIKSVVTTYYLRKWMAENNYFPELSDLVTLDENSKPVVDVLDMSNSHIQSLLRSCLSFIKKVNANKAVIDEETNKIMNYQDSEGSGGDSSNDSAYDGDSESGGLDDMGGMDELGGLDDEGEESTDESSEDSEEEAEEEAEDAAPEEEAGDDL